MILRLEKGTPLTTKEMDDNLSSLLNRVTLTTDQIIENVKTFNNLNVLDPDMHDNSNHLISTQYTTDKISLGKIDRILTNVDQTINDVYTFSTLNTNDPVDSNNPELSSNIPILVQNIGKCYVSTENPVNPHTDPIYNYWIKLSPTTPRTIEQVYMYIAGKWEMVGPVEKFLLGWGHSLMEKLDGTVWSTGENYYGELGLGDNTSRNLFTQIDSSFNNPNKLVVGYYHSIIEKSDGTVWICGSNLNGQLGLGDNTSRNLFTQIDSSFNNPNKIVLGQINTIIEKSDGTVWVCGENSYGQLGLGNNTDINVFVQLPGIINPNKIVFGQNHSFIEKSDGTVWVCGRNDYGQLGLGNNTSRNVFVQLPGIINPNKIELGSFHSFIEKSDGTVWVCGNNSSGQLGLGDNTNRNVFVQFASSFNNPNKMAVGSGHTFIEKSDGTVWSCGHNDYGQLGLGNIANRNYFVQIDASFNIPNKIVLGTNGSFIEKSDGTVWVCGYNYQGQLGLGSDHTNISLFTELVI